jgi:predicted homoserine dehydrogenase-like protein
VYGKLMPASDSVKLGGLPLGLAHGVKVKTAIKAGQVVKWEDVGFDANNAAVKFRREMESLYFPKHGAPKKKQAQ